MTERDLLQVAGSIKERLKALEEDQAPRTGGLKQSPGRRAENQINGILNRLDALEKQVDELADFAHSMCQTQYQHAERLAQLEAWRLKDVPVIKERLVGDGSTHVPDDSSEL